MSKIACIYHSVDLDGWMSAAIVKYYYRQQNINNTTTNEQINFKSEGLHTDVPILNSHNELNFIGYNYGQPIPDLTGYDKVIMCDISFPLEDMKHIAINILNSNNTDKFVWLDHHKSAIETMYGFMWNYSYIKGLQDTNFAACELTWKYLFPNEPMPEIVRLLGRYDCFGHKPEWKTIEGYEGIYEVSNHGKVRSLNRVVVENNTNKSKYLSGKELSAAISKRGYLVVNLFKDNVGQMRNVHDLVARAFIPNPENKPTVNHIDSNRLNCRDTNLEWSTYAENNEHSITNGDRGFPVIQSTKSGDFIHRFDSIIMAEQQTGIASQNIGKACKGERSSAGGFRWEYDTKKQTPQFIPEDEETYVLAFQYGARQYISNYELAYEYLLTYLTEGFTHESIISSIYDSGATIYQYLCTEAKQIYANRFDLDLPKWITNDYTDGGSITFKPLSGTNAKFAAINRERFNPVNFGIDYHKDGYDGVACFWYTDGELHFSLYNDNCLVDCSAIAKQFGGGGHKGAAGFVLKSTYESSTSNMYDLRNKFASMLTDRTIF